MTLRHHLYIASEPKHRDFVGDLVGILRREGWSVFDGHADIAAGEEPGVARSAAWGESAWYVLVRSQGGDATLRAEVLRALERRRTDPLGVRVLPVHLEELDPLDAKFSSLGLLQAIPAMDRDVKKAANEIIRVAELKGLRHWGQRKAKVSLLAVKSELGEAARKVREMLEGLRSQVAEVSEIDLADSHALELAEDSLLRVVVLGGSTAGPEGAARVRALLEDPTRVVLACMDPMPMEVMMRYLGELQERISLVGSLSTVNKPIFFANASEAPTRLREAVAERLELLLPKPPASSIGGRAILEPWERWYLESQSPTWEDGRVGGLRGWSKNCRLERALLYVSLHAGPGRWRRSPQGGLRLFPKGSETPTPDGVRRDDPVPVFLDEVMAPVFLDELLSHEALPHTVVVGEAGTGKTVLLQHMAWSLAAHHWGMSLPEECRLNIEALGAGRNIVPLPVLLEARTLAEVAWRGGAIERVLADAFGGRAPESAVQQGLDQGRYLLLLDSLDEVPSTTGRERVLNMLKGLTRTSRCRVVLTTRPTAHTPVSVPSPFERIDIAPLDENRRQSMVARWRAVENLSAEASKKLPEALTGLSERFPRDGRGLSPLENPLLLTCVLLVFIEQQRLPDNLADLYERMIRHLCDRRPEDPEARPAAQRQSAAWRREMLIRVGQALQEHGTTAMPATQLSAWLVGKQFETVYDAREALDQLAVTTGLFRFEEEGGQQVVRPWHKSFQEYLAACQIAGRTGSESDIVQQLWEAGVLSDPAWGGCLRFAVGAFGMGMLGAERARGFMNALMELTRQPGAPDEGRLLGLAAAGIAEYQKEYFPGPEPTATLRSRIAERFAASGAQWPWRDRLLALSALGRLPKGDPRLHDPTTSAEGWVDISAGTYNIGDDSEASQPLSQQQVKVGRFFLRAWPVTVSEYCTYLESHPSEEPWEWKNQVHRHNFPVVGVSWHQARAFCRWASRRWQRPEAEGNFDLPDSHEWEVAARAQGGPFPWGAAPAGERDVARANYAWGTDSPGAPTPVGLFPAGNMGEILDMAGNVREWCASVFRENGDIPYHMTENISDAQEHPSQMDNKLDEGPRVLRGGSWVDRYPRYLRVAYRLRSHPRSQHKDLGFRLIFRTSS